MYNGAIAQLGERLLCKQEVIGSIPIGSTSLPHLARYNILSSASCMSASLFKNPEDSSLI
jgi:hypothetical protein